MPHADEMIRQLVEGQEAVTRTARQVFPVAERAGDAWMLRSLLAE